MGRDCSLIKDHERGKKETGFNQDNVRIRDRELGIFDRVLWLLVVVGFLAVAAKITKNFWSQWRDEQVDVKPPAVKVGILCVKFTNYNRFDLKDIFRLCQSLRTRPSLWKMFLYQR